MNDTELGRLAKKFVLAHIEAFDARIEPGRVVWVPDGSSIEKEDERIRGSYAAKQVVANELWLQLLAACGVHRIPERP